MLNRHSTMFELTNQQIIAHEKKRINNQQLALKSAIKIMATKAIRENASCLSFTDRRRERLRDDIARRVENKFISAMAGKS